MLHMYLSVSINIDNYGLPLENVKLCKSTQIVWHQNHLIEFKKSFCEFHWALRSIYGLYNRPNAQAVAAVIVFAQIFIS